MMQGQNELPAFLLGFRARPSVKTGHGTRCSFLSLPLGSQEEGVGGKRLLSVRITFLYTHTHTHTHAHTHTHTHTHTQSTKIQEK